MLVVKIEITRGVYLQILKLNLFYIGMNIFVYLLLFMLGRFVEMLFWTCVELLFSFTVLVDSVSLVYFLSFCG